VADCSIRELRRLEKLGHHRLIVEYDEQTVSVTMRTTDVFETLTRQDDWSSFPR